jgi:hypothetical protein
VLTWIPGSTTNLEQVIGDTNWAALAQGKTVLTASQTATRFHILGNGLGYSFEDNGKLIFLFGDTISDDSKEWKFSAADPLAWSTNTEGESPLLLNFFTNYPYFAASNTPVFVQPYGIDMGAFDVPNSGISLSSGVFLVCNTGSDADLPNPQSNDYSVLVTFYEKNLVLSTNTYAITNYFATNRVISRLDSINLPGVSPLQGRFINVSMHEWGTNVMMFGTGEYRSGDVFLCQIPTTSFVTGEGTLYFTGLTNAQPTWSAYESNCVPLVQDNPTNGPAWPTTTGTVGNVSVIYCTNLQMWLMTYDGGRGTGVPQTEGVYFTYAAQPWGPWSTPQLIFNKIRDHGEGVFIYDAINHTGPAGPTIGTNNPTTTAGGDLAPIMIERFTRVTNSTLFIYYTMSTWNPYTVVKMRSAFDIKPVISAPARKQAAFTFSWSAPTSQVYQIDFTTNLLSPWNTLTNFIRSTNGTFEFTDTGTNSGGLGADRFYRLATPQ